MKQIALYKTISNKIITEIESGKYEKGELLPTESKLCKKYFVSRVTIRQALKMLVDKQYISSKQGSGSRVIYCEKKELINKSSKIIPFSEEMRLIGKIPSSKIISFELINADKQLAKKLSLNLDDKVFRYERLLFGDNYPYCFEEGFMPLKYFDDLTINHLQGSKIKYIQEDKKIMLQYSQQVVHAIAADERLSKYLKVAINDPILDVLHITYDINDNPIMLTTCRFNSKIYQANYYKTTT
ncbi:MAG: GntR family transcriptional regulator [Anaerorhabdus sp.]